MGNQYRAVPVLMFNEVNGDPFSKAKIHGRIIIQCILYNELKRERVQGVDIILILLSKYSMPTILLFSLL